MLFFSFSPACRDAIDRVLVCWLAERKGAIRWNSYAV